MGGKGKGKGKGEGKRNRKNKENQRSQQYQAKESTEACKEEKDCDKGESVGVAEEFSPAKAMSSLGSAGFKFQADVRKGEENVSKTRQDAEAKVEPSVNVASPTKATAPTPGKANLIEAQTAFPQFDMSYYPTNCSVAGLQSALGRFPKEQSLTIGLSKIHAWLDDASAQQNVRKSLAERIGILSSCNADGVHSCVQSAVGRFPKEQSLTIGLSKIHAWLDDASAQQNARKSLAERIGILSSCNASGVHSCKAGNLKDSISSHEVAPENALKPAKVYTAKAPMVAKPESTEAFAAPEKEAYADPEKNAEADAESEKVRAMMQAQLLKGLSDGSLAGSLQERTKAQSHLLSSAKSGALGGALRNNDTYLGGPCSAHSNWGFVKKAVQLCSPSVSSESGDTAKTPGKLNDLNQLDLKCICFTEAEKKCGFQIEWPFDKSGPIVTNLVVGGAAELHGICKGERIVQLNNIETQGQSTERLLEEFQKRPLSMKLQHKAIKKNEPVNLYKYPWED